MARAEIAKAKAALKPFGRRAQALRDLADFIVEREN
jgi:geranylgeranyl pyrophosphate synthase